MPTPSTPSTPPKETRAEPDGALLAGALDAAGVALLIGRAVRGADGNTTDFRWLHATARAAELLGRERGRIERGTLMETLPWMRGLGLLAAMERTVATGAGAELRAEPPGLGALAFALSRHGDCCVLAVSRQGTEAEAGAKAGTASSETAQAGTAQSGTTETPPRAGPGAARPAPAAAAEGRGLSVLVVEDNETTREMLASVLRGHGHAVTAAANGRVAVSELAGGAFDIVLMDMQMPELDGAATTRLIRAMQGPGRRVPIVALTAEAQPEQRARHLDLDLDAYLTKPIEWPRLAHVMQALTGQRGGPARVAGEARPAGEPPAQGAREEDPPATLDRTVVAELLAALGPARMAGLLDRFGEGAEAVLARMRAAASGADADALRGAAHDLKGIAGNFGAVRASRLAAEVERAAGEASPSWPDAVGPLLAELERALAEAVAEMRRA
jgi:CheY-like chemotaxis protein